MDERALGMLELPEILERLAAATASEPGRALAASLRPSADPDEVERRQQLTREAIALFDRADEPDLTRIAEIRPAVELAARGSALDPAALNAVARTIGAAIAARQVLDQSADATSLAQIGSAIEPALGSVAEQVTRAVEEDGSDLRASASPTLRRLRRELREGRAAVAERLRRLARDPDLQSHLQDDFVTERAGRPVLALRASARASVPGIVHDTSGSGQTLFVEPFAVVEDNNRLREAESAEREEVVRILRELSGRVGERAPTLEALVEAAGRIDLALACGMLARRWRGAHVTISHKVVLRGARHPLLDPAAAVPIDLELGGLRALVISGPNTGGKTVALKTLGLAAVLHQCGLRPPADEAELPVFDRILVDIGDEQSIAMSLSTFSGHVRNLVEILDRATDGSLVLLDEIAAGTDPVEGAALAQALLDVLARQARLTVTTSHYPELKEWASATDDAVNAATGFDPETQAPLYTVTLGRPGTSHALRIAARLGVPEAVVADARSRVAPERLRVAELLAEAEHALAEVGATRDEASGERDRAEQARRAAESREQELEEEIARIRASAGSERERARATGEHELAETRAELAALRDEIRTARKLERERGRVSTSRGLEKERERDRRLSAAAERAERARETLPERPEPEPPPSGPLAPGDPVVAVSLGVRGTIAEIENGQAVVLGLSGQRIRVPLERLRADHHGHIVGSTRPAVTVRASIAPDPEDELDLRGRSAQEAIEAVRGFVDAASLAGLGVVRVIHGRGTGTIRKAVRAELARHPLVEHHASESADGATVVHLTR